MIKVTADIFVMYLQVYRKKKYSEYLLLENIYFTKLQFPTFHKYKMLLLYVSANGLTPLARNAAQFELLVKEHLKHEYTPVC